MDRLSSATLETLPASIARPRYDRAQVQPGVMHLGIGAFHRAHQAVILDDILATGDLRWGIRAASLRSASVRDQMMPQDCLYTVLVRDGTAQEARVVGSVLDVMVAPDDPAALVAALASPETHIVTLTITEKGYKLDPATGALLETDPAVAHDIAGLDAPQTAAGFLVAALALRHARGLTPFTAISCDNLPSNGHRLRSAVLALARRHSEPLAAWIEANSAFPETMVDRIVPATNPEDVTAFVDESGLQDQALVKTEPFVQWVIEDRFCGPRPQFGAGVQITDSVAHWEEAKLRLLNGAHSAMAYLGGLAGIAHIHEVLQVPAMRIFVNSLWNEVEETLNPPAELDIAKYRTALMARFDNASLMHRTHQIAMDGSQKLPQRLFATITDRRRNRLGADALALAVASWVRWQAAIDDRGNAFVVDDPLAAELRERLEGAEDAHGRIAAVFTMDAIVSPVLAADAEFVAMITEHLYVMESQGAMQAVARLVKTTVR